MAYAEIGGADELRDVLGVPAGRAVTKERTRLHAVDREWLALSPFCILATSDADGTCDASPGRRSQQLPQFSGPADLRIGHGLIAPGRPGCGRARTSPRAAR